MGFSDQEGDILNSSETPELGDSGQIEATESQLEAAKSADADLEPVVEDQVEPEMSETPEPTTAAEEHDPEETISDEKPTEPEPVHEEAEILESASESSDGEQVEEEIIEEPEPTIAAEEHDQEQTNFDEKTTEPEPAKDEAEVLDSAAESPVDEQLEEEMTQEAQPDPSDVLETETVPEISIEKATAALLQDDAPETDLESPEADQEEVIPEEDDGRAWYVVHCYSGYENKVRHNLEQRIETMGMKDMIFDIVVPTEEEIEVKEGKRRTVERRVFPGYILVNMIMTEESWYVVRNTPGVTGFVGMGNTPTPLRPEEVSQIIKRMEAEAPRIKVTFKSGERVRIVDGPFNDFRGTVAEIDMERAKVRVMVNFFGRETPVELDFLQVEKT
jgi:transcriptional antiterminator NusG